MSLRTRPIVLSTYKYELARIARGSQSKSAQWFCSCESRSSGHTLCMPRVADLALSTSVLAAGWRLTTRLMVNP